MMQSCQHFRCYGLCLANIKHYTTYTRVILIIKSFRGDAFFFVAV